MTAPTKAMRRKLWKGSGCCVSWTRNGTPWISNHYFAARERVVGGVPDWKQVAMSTFVKPIPLDAYGDGPFVVPAQAHCTGTLEIGMAWSIEAENWIGDPRPVVVVGERLKCASLAPHVQVPFNREWFTALDAMCRANGGTDLRLDVKAGAVTWWTTGKRPVVLACLFGIRRATSRPITDLKLWPS